MELGNLDGKQRKALIASALLILVWIGTPLYLQAEHGISAVQVSFAIIVFYYISFRLWKRLKAD